MAKKCDASDKLQPRCPRHGDWVIRPLSSSPVTVVRTCSAHLPQMLKTVLVSGEQAPFLIERKN